MKVLKFSAPWCGPCKTLTQWLQVVEMPIEIENIDIEENTELVQKYNIRSVPAVVLVDENEEPLKTAVGLEPSKDLIQSLPL